MMSITVCTSDWVSGTEFILTAEVTVAVHHYAHAIVLKKLEIHISGLEIHTNAFHIVRSTVRMQLPAQSTQNLLRNHDRNWEFQIPNCLGMVSCFLLWGPHA